MSDVVPSRSTSKHLRKKFFSCLNFVENLQICERKSFFFSEVAWFLRKNGKICDNFERRPFLFWRTLSHCVLGLWPWPRAFLSLASRGSVLERYVLGLCFVVSLALALSLMSSTPPLITNRNILF